MRRGELYRQRYRRESFMACAHAADMIAEPVHALLVQRVILDSFVVFVNKHNRIALVSWIYNRMMQVRWILIRGVEHEPTLKR